VINVADTSCCAISRPVSRRTGNCGLDRKWLKKAFLLFRCAAILFLSTAMSGADNKDKPDVPSIAAEAGPCSVEMTVTAESGKPVYAALIRVRVSYGFLGIRRVDLEVGTNAEGKAKFVGLPQDGERVLYFRAAKGGLKGAAVHSTAQDCDARHSIILRPR
jgi:hypothetical protein